MTRFMMERCIGPRSSLLFLAISFCIMELISTVYTKLGELQDYRSIKPESITWFNDQKSRIFWHYIFSEHERGNWSQFLILWLDINMLSQSSVHCAARPKLGLILRLNRIRAIPPSLLCFRTRFYSSSIWLWSFYSPPPK